MVVSDNLQEAAQSMAAARNPQHRHSYITYPFRFEVFADDMKKIATANPIMAMTYGYRILAAMTDNVLSDATLMQRFKDLKPDLIIGDATASYGHWLTALLGIPSIEFDVGTSSGLLHSTFGGQVNPAYIPASGTFYPSTGMSFWQRCYNLGATALTKAMAHVHREYGPIRRLARKHGVPNLPGQGPTRPLLLLVNFDWSLEPPRPVAPNTKYLGALMPRLAAALPASIMAWLEGRPAAAAAAAAAAADDAVAPGIAGAAASGDTDAAAQGTATAAALPVVFISFGASFLAPQAAMPALAAALAATRGSMRFLLRLRHSEQQQLQEALEELGVVVSADELLVLPAVPQNDLLGHPAVAAFVTQGGYLSMQEAAYHGVPVIGVPLMIGHTELVTHARDHGRGLLVTKESLLSGDAGPLTAALTQIVSNSSFRQQAAVTAARLRAHPVSPGQQAADWVAYALAASPGAGSFLHTQGQDMPWFQVLLLDVLAVYAASAALAVAALATGMRVLAASWYAARHSHHTAAAGTSAGSSRRKQE
uniref:UDP-glycosyltransferases domain-containing protein n=1 Tax=Tetradesmus obliquus TaxID=3088 RepID=A0A383VRS4_TETOB|eukprot:jgi/Sobl393_1/14555/SZX68225.1